MNDTDDMRTFAAIMLRVPRSGKPEIDDMIRESRRTEIAAMVMQQLIPGAYTKLLKTADGNPPTEAMIAQQACCFADALLTELSREGTTKA